MSYNETLNTIKKRYIHERAIYTWCGIALVAVNPYQEQDIYGDQVVETYHSAAHSVYLQLDPHIYAVTEDAYSKLDLHCKDQSIIVSGESGAGKTVSAKHAMRYLASIAPGGASSTSGGGGGGGGGSKGGASSSGSASSKSGMQRIENRVLASNPIMEAIGNARTVRNDNSSRFGKYIQIYFERHNRRILGANMRTYLLEKSRVTKQQAGERNFHIFYQLLNYAHRNPTKTSHLKLLDPEDSNRKRTFAYLGGLEPLESSSASQRDDLRRFNEALRTLQIDDQRVQVIYRVVAGILHGGNIRFEPSEPGDHESPCRIASGAAGEFHFGACCELIGLDPELARKRLTVKLLRSGPREVIEQPQSCRKAEYARDAMLKYVYECLFTWLVGLINLSLSSSRSGGGELGAADAASELPAALACTPTKSAGGFPPSLFAGTPLKSPSGKKSILDGNQQQEQQQQFIGVLDIYGFENFKSNSFEQFCINYANEVLQQQYNQHVFKLEQEEYAREGIDWTFIEYCDNQPVIDIIEARPIGILNLLDEECKMPKGTDRSWCAKLYDHLLPRSTGGSKAGAQSTAAGRFKRPKLNSQSSFTICHYAEEVDYEVDSFLEKNRDSIAEEQCEMLRNSEVLAYIFEDPQLLQVPQQQQLQPGLQNSRSRGARTARSATVGYQFRGSLAALIRTLNATEPHYIRCIKPNDEKKAFEFDEERAVQQLKACGVYETIRISNNGFPSRWHYKDFAKRYCILVYGRREFEELARASLARRGRQARALAQLEQQQVAAAAAAAAESDGCESLATESGSEESEGEQQQQQEAAQELEQNQPGRHFMCQFSSADIRPICEAVCRCAYGPGSPYEQLRTDEERAYLEQLRERHGEKPSAIYQMGKTKIFFRAGQVAYLERARNLRLRDYTVTIQRHVRGWLARRSFLVRRELFLEQMRREASLISLQNQVSSLQTELEQAKEEREEQAGETVSRLGSMYSLLIDLMFNSIQPLVIGAVLEHEALDSPGEPFSSLDSSSLSSSSSASADGSRSSSPAGGRKRRAKHSMDYLVRELDKFHDLMRRNCVPEDIAVQAFKQIFYLICAHSLNQLLIRRDLCQFRKAMQINFNLSCLVQWCREHYLVKWRLIVEQLDPITQATKLLQTRKSSEDIATIEEVCNKLRPSQIIKMLNMYTSSYEEQITFEFIHELEDYLHRTRARKHADSLKEQQQDCEQQPTGSEVDEGQATTTTTGEEGAVAQQMADGQADSGQFDLNNNGGANTAESAANNDLLMDTKHYFAFVDLAEPPTGTATAAVPASCS